MTLLRCMQSVGERYFAVKLAEYLQYTDGERVRWLLLGC